MYILVEISLSMKPLDIIRYYPINLLKYQEVNCDLGVSC